jgi:hypothetical protein
LLMAGTAHANMVLPGFGNGMPDPMSDVEPWWMDGGRLELTNATDTSWHGFDIGLPIKDTGLSGNLTVTWRHGFTCETDSLCLNFGAAEGRLMSFNSNGTISSLSSWNSSTGTPAQTVLVPAGGSAMLQFRMKADGNGNDHYFSKIVTSNTVSL